MMPRFAPFLTLSIALSLASCGPKPEAHSTAAPAKPATQAETAVPAPTPTPERAQEQAAPAAAAAPSTSEVEMDFFAEAGNLPTTQPVNIGDFGSSEPAERKDIPGRGVIRIGPNDIDQSTGAHWDTYTSTGFKAKRWGRYQVRLTYILNRMALGMQFRMGDLVVKKTLLSTPVAKKTYLGDIYISQPGDVPFMLLTPPTDGQGFAIQEITLIPTCEGELPRQADDGSIVLNAKDATTWSEHMRYEPKPEKNCLGFWTSEEDLAEWEFEVMKPGRYVVTLSHGCGGGNHGSEVAVRHGEQTLKFVTEDTGGFQSWKDVKLGEIEIKDKGRQRLIIAPLNKVKSAVLDVQKVVLTPVG